jgi:CO dehydrogenase/acetyl-CoA synthase delta subunit
MAELQKMPIIEMDQNKLKEWGSKWLKDINEENGQSKAKFSFDRQQSVNFASFIDLAFGIAISRLLGNINVETPLGNSLLPKDHDIVEVGAVRIVGGVRPQNFDAAYRPDGPRIVFDSKTLNEEKSIGKNWQNMINDLGTEATTVHTRFPYSLVIFFVVLPKPALNSKQEKDIIRTLERLGTRKSVLDQPHLAEAISMIVWDPKTGKIDENIPEKNSNLRLEKIHSIIEEIYLDRYKGLPPHD